MPSKRSPKPDRPIALHLRSSTTLRACDDDYFLRALRVQVVPTPGAVLPGLIGLGTAAIRKKRQGSADEAKDQSDQA
ncbi:MAG: PTPA-CTERM sorting domain-containing protein [Leptolyngbya sp. LCM1.Bin17]|nr:MAG: PTPA-CTERM sorting domain-containing protein [Leptolyngbya sp. LCM1.Bin17]